MRYLRDKTSNRYTAYVCGAREGSGNIGDAIVEEMFRQKWWRVIGDDCAMSDGSRPPGGNLPNDDVAREHGYTVTEQGRYQWFDAPSYDMFLNDAPDALVVTLGSTYKDHFADLRPGTLETIMRANLLLPLECARRFVAASEADRRLYDGIRRIGGEHSLKHIVLIGSYAHDHPFTNGTLYCAAKAGLDAAGRALGWELTDRGYRVHVVHPYHVQGTPMWAEVQGNMERTRGMTSEEADAYARKDLKMPDLLTPTEVAEVVRVLLTEPAMGWLSGQSLRLYGGTR